MKSIGKDDSQMMNHTDDSKNLHDRKPSESEAQTCSFVVTNQVVEFRDR